MTEEQRKRKNARTAKWWKNNPVKVKALRAKWRVKHPNDNSALSIKWHKEHPQAVVQAKAIWLAKNPDYNKNYRQNYFEQKAGRPKPKDCEVCGKPGRICFDHDHTTGEFRGWLCNGCNTALGYAADSIAILIGLTNYLERPNIAIQISRNQRKRKILRPKTCEVCQKCPEYPEYICFDHDHKTGLFRGWLCHSCNIVLGRVKDSSDLLRKLVIYLELHNKEKQHGTRKKARRAQSVC